MDLEILLDKWDEYHIFTTKKRQGESGQDGYDDDDDFTFYGFMEWLKDNYKSTLE